MRAIDAENVALRTALAAMETANESVLLENKVLRNALRKVAEKDSYSITIDVGRLRAVRVYGPFGAIAREALYRHYEVDPSDDEVANAVVEIRKYTGEE